MTLSMNTQKIKTLEERNISQGNNFDLELSIAILSDELLSRVCGGAESTNPVHDVIVLPLPENSGEIKQG